MLPIYRHTNVALNGSDTDDDYLTFFYHNIYLRWLNLASVMQNNCTVFIHTKTKKGDVGN